MINLSQISLFYYNFQNTKLRVRSIWIALKKQDDLYALVQWATRKRLTKVRRVYLAQLHQVEDRLWHHQVRWPGLVTFCEFVFAAYKQIIPSPKYKRGSAAEYRLSI
jgi:hypothetical protein